MEQNVGVSKDEHLNILSLNLYPPFSGYWKSTVIASEDQGCVSKRSQTATS